MDKCIVLNADLNDAEALCDIFLNHISAHKEYISHGEIQMGVGTGCFIDGKLVADVSADARRCWMKYITGNLTEPDRAYVGKAVSESGDIKGFCVAEIQEDGAEPFGMLCDLLVTEEYRGTGAGSALFGSAIEWFHANEIKDIYLESGLNNHSAHEYFIRKGFVKVSEIYKLK